MYGETGAIEVPTLEQFELGSCVSKMPLLSAVLLAVAFPLIALSLDSFDAQPILSVSPDHIDVDRSFVSVTWAYVAQPSRSDWIGVYTPPPQDNNFTFRTPVKLKMCTDDPSHLTNGTGTVTFSLLNMRDNYVFALFRSGVELAETPYYPGPYSPAAAFSSVVSLSDALQNRPNSVHLALGAAQDEMVVMWTTKTLGDPVVQYGVTSVPPNPLSSVAVAQTTTYLATEMCPGGAADSR